MGFSQIVAPGSSVKSRLAKDRVEMQIVGGQPQSRFYIGRKIAEVLGWDHTTRVKILHGHGKDDFGKLQFVEDKKGLRVGRYGKNAYVVQAGKKKYFELNDPQFKYRDEIELFSTTGGCLQITLPTQVTDRMGKDLRQRLKKGIEDE